MPPAVRRRRTTGMLERMRPTTCPDCRTEVPSGRWCNRCGAPLRQPAPSAPSGRRWGATVATAVAAVALAGAVGAAVVRDPGADDPGAGLDDGGVVLAEDAPQPPAPPPTPSRPTPPDEPPGERVDVICSDLRIRSVPLPAVATDEPGALVELANGTCVVMGPNGAVAP